MSLNIKEFVSIKAFNTMGLESVSRYFVQIESIEALREALAFARVHGLPVIPLGEGSNVILSDTLDALVLLNRLKGREVLAEREGKMLLKVGAGECWDSLVLWTLEQNLYGLENLARIPGCAGVAPVQNIGAYGAELKDILVSLEAVDRQTGAMMTISAEECELGYRDSVFKNRLKDQVVITSITVRLDRTLRPNLDYDTLKERVRLISSHSLMPSGMDIYQAVCAIRKEKLPDPDVLGNVGSFFKNPVISDTHRIRLKAAFAHIPAHKVAEGWKLAAGWLIEQCGFKGFTRENVGVYDKQALVLVNHGNACGKDILALAEEIQAAVSALFSVGLEIEPRIY